MPSAFGSRRVIRLALLICGEFTKNPSADGTYLNVYKRWLNASLPPHSDTRLIMDGYDVVDEEYPAHDLIEHYDLLMLTGSPHDACADEPWIIRLVGFVQNIANNYTDVRIFGVCFGHQIVSRALGGKIERNTEGWEVGQTLVRTTYIGRLLFGVDKLALQELHQDHVILPSLATPLITGEIYLLGQSDKTDDQGMVKFYPLGPSSDSPDFKLVEHVHIITIQGHPEFDEKIIAEITRQRDEKITISDSAFKEYFCQRRPLTGSDLLVTGETGERWGADYDGVLVVGKMFWQMFGVDYGKQYRKRRTDWGLGDWIGSCYLNAIFFQYRYT